MKSFARLSVAVGAVVMLSSHAAQARTSECVAGTGAQGFNSGYQAEYGVVMNLWNGVFNADGYQLEAFIEAVDIPYIPGYSSSAFLRCRDQGLIEGVGGALDAITQSVAVEGLANGQAVGTFNGQLFCGVTGQQQHCGTVAKSVPLLSSTAAQSCKAAFLGYVNANCPGKQALDPYFQSTVDAACSF